MKRLWDAFLNSARAWRRLITGEAAFQQEILLLAMSLPLGWLIASSWQSYSLLVLSIVFLVIVEVLNTGIEAVCDAVTQEFDRNIQLAKDCGSLAVLLAIIMVACIWAMALWQWLAR